MMFIFLTFIPGSSFAGVFAGWLVHKIFFTIAGAFVYLYLFLSVPGSFDIELGNLSDNPVSVAIITRVRSAAPRISGDFLSGKAL
jgi:hypothetical protein